MTIIKVSPISSTLFMQFLNVVGFLRSRRDKSKQKKGKNKKKESDNQSNKEDKSDLYVKRNSFKLIR